MIYGYDFLRPYIGGSGYYDDNGDWIASDGEWGDPVSCDVQQPSSGEANVLTDQAGEKVEYAYIVWLDEGVQDFSIGDKVLLAVGGGSGQEYTVKGFRRYRSHAKLWV